MRGYRLFLALTIFLCGPVSAAEDLSVEQAAIATVLDAYHAAAAAGNWEAYFALMSDDGVFLGTDASERWPKEEFRAYAGNRRGWVYLPTDRHINVTPDGNSAWFDEILSSESFGTTRGTGVLIKTASGWKISQYHLTIPIPNPLARQLTDTIKEFEAR